MIASRHLLPILLLIASALSAGCATDPTTGYASTSLYRSDIASVAIPLFTNDTFHRDVEVELTDAVIKEIQARTPYKVTSQSRADTVLLGRIRDVEIEQISKSRLTGLGEEVVLSLTIDFQWRDQRTEKPIVARKSFAAHGLFVPSTPTGERLELGRTAAVQRLAEDLVAELQDAW